MKEKIINIGISRLILFVSACLLLQSCVITTHQHGKLQNRIYSKKCLLKPDEFTSIIRLTHTQGYNLRVYPFRPVDTIFHEPRKGNRLDTEVLQILAKGTRINDTLKVKMLYVLPPAIRPTYAIFQSRSKSILGDSIDTPSIPLYKTYRTKKFKPQYSNYEIFTDSLFCTLNVVFNGQQKEKTATTGIHSFNLNVDTLACYDAYKTVLKSGDTTELKELLSNISQYSVNGLELYVDFEADSQKTYIKMRSLTPVATYMRRLTATRYLVFNNKKIKPIPLLGVSCEYDLSYLKPYSKIKFKESKYEKEGFDKKSFRKMVFFLRLMKVYL